MVTFVDDDLSEGGCPSTGTISRTWRVEDLCGNAAECVQVITIIDDEPPVITCPPSSCNAGIDTVFTGVATAIDNCSVPADMLIAFTVEPGPDDCGPNVTLRNWTATDLCGNTASCVQPLNLDETDSPSIICPENIQISCEQSSGPEVTGNPVVSDACTADRDIKISYSDKSEIVDKCGNTVIAREWSIEDACGNTAGCEQVIRIVDQTAPAIICPNDTVISCTSERTPNETGWAKASDNCTPEDNIVIEYEDDLSGLSGCDGFMLRRWTATDLCGNVSSCSQTITISDFGGRRSGDLADVPAASEVSLSTPFRMAMGSLYFEMAIHGRLAWRIGFHGPQMLQRSKLHNESVSGFYAIPEFVAMYYLPQKRWLPFIGAGSGLSVNAHSSVFSYENPTSGSGEWIFRPHILAGGHFPISGNLHLSLEARLFYIEPNPGSSGGLFRPGFGAGFYWRIINLGDKSIIE